MAEAFATPDDVIALYRSLSSDEVDRCATILPLISDTIRAEYEARTGEDYDEYLAEHPYMSATVKLVVCDVAFRFLRTNLEGESYTQQSQGAIGYTWSGTYAVPGGGIMNAFMERDWKRLRVHVPRARSVEFSYDLRNENTAT